MQERGFRLSPRNHDHVTNIKIELKIYIYIQINKMAGKWSSGNSTADNRFYVVLFLNNKSYSHRLRVASWKQRILFYPLANEAVQKSSIYISSTVAMSLFPYTVIIFLSLH